MLIYLMVEIVPFEVTDSFTFAAKFDIFEMAENTNRTNDGSLDTGRNGRVSF